jgi:DNA modification methylase
MPLRTNASDLKVKYYALQELTPDPRNSRSHTPQQVRTVAASIQAYGWTNPILIDEQRGVIAGHARLEAARLLGIEEVPTICLAHMTAAQKRAYIIADNRMNEIAGTWDRKMLALEHDAIRLLDPAFDLTSTGFSQEDIDILFDNSLDLHEDGGVEPDSARTPASQPGDLWALGAHRIFCGNALEAKSFERLMDGEKAQIVVADSPYNVRVNGHVATKGKHPEFAMASGEMSEERFTGFLTQTFANLIKFSADGSIHYLFMDWRHLAEMTAATRQYEEMKNLICWAKQSAGMGSFYRSQHELIFVMKNGSAPHLNNFGLGEKGRHRSNVWNYPGLCGWTPRRDEELAMHPTVKPVAMIADALRDCSRKRDVVLDCFGGSGTTLIAAQQTGRRARLIEIDPVYVDVTVRRWEAETGEQAFLIDDGRSFKSIESERRVL